MINHQNRPFRPMATASWQQVIGVTIGCLGLCWSSPGLAQISPPHPPIGPSTDTPGANIDQIVVPPASDVPEEILRTEIIFEARSPLDGTPMSPAEYAQLQSDLAAPQTTTTLTSEIRYIIFLLQARRAFKPVIPFLP